MTFKTYVQKRWVMYKMKLYTTYHYEFINSGHNSNTYENITRAAQEYRAYKKFSTSFLFVE